MYVQALLLLVFQNLWQQLGLSACSLTLLLMKKACQSFCRTSPSRCV